MGSLTNYGEQKFIQHATGTPFTPPSTVYLGLSEADPTDDMSGWSEGDYTGYARVALSFAAASGRSILQSALAQFPLATGGGNSFSHWAIFDALSSGNGMAHGALNDTVVVVPGNQPSVASGEINITVGSGGFSDYLVHAILNLMFRNVAFTSPANYLGFVTSASGDSAPGTEATGGSYAREIINPAGGSSPAWGAVSGNTITLANDVLFDDPSGDWSSGADQVGFVVWDALSVGSGNYLMYDNSPTDQPVGVGDTVKVPSGGLTVVLN